MRDQPIILVSSALWLQMIAWGVGLWYTAGLLVLAVALFVSGREHAAIAGVMALAGACGTFGCGWLISMVAKYLMRRSRVMVIIVALPSVALGIAYGALAVVGTGATVRVMFVSYAIVVILWSALLVRSVFWSRIDGEPA
jgi:hypothetical protein